jgi:hypothetical protein
MAVVDASDQHDLWHIEGCVRARPISLTNLRIRRENGGDGYALRRGAV